MERKVIRTSRLDIAYLENGPANGSPVLLLHGFPDDATGWHDVMTVLAAHGRRALAPFVRGCGETKFLRPETPRAGDFASLGQDAIDFMDALHLSNVTIVVRTGDHQLPKLSLWNVQIVFADSSS